MVNAGRGCKKKKEKEDLNSCLFSLSLSLSHLSLRFQFESIEPLSEEAIIAGWCFLACEREIFISTDFTPFLSFLRPSLFLSFLEVVVGGKVGINLVAGHQGESIVLEEKEELAGQKCVLAPRGMSEVQFFDIVVVVRWLLEK